MEKEIQEKMIFQAKETSKELRARDSQFMDSILLLKYFMYVYGIVYGGCKVTNIENSVTSQLIILCWILNFKTQLRI